MSDLESSSYERRLPPGAAFAFIAVSSIFGWALIFAAWIALF